MSQRGVLVVLEGCDRAGKSTQCKLLKDTLSQNGQTVELFSCPDRTTAIGAVIGDYLSKRCELDDHAVHLLFSANRWENIPKILELIEEGAIVIIDRYAYSGVAFTAAKPGFTIDWCKQPEVGLPRPDLVLYLQLSSEDAAKRADFGNERYEQTDFQLKVAENFNIIMSNEDLSYWKIVDASKDIHTVHGELVASITDLVKSELPPLTKLWTS